MATFEYSQDDGSQRLNREHIYRLLNNYRFWKFMIAMMMSGKTELSSYKILEAGCGAGDKLRFFTELCARPENCYGFDISEEAIALCKRRSPDAMNFQVGSILEIPFENSMFDIVLCSNVLGCFSSDADLLKISDELWRVIKFSGVLLVLDINENFWSTHANNEQYFMDKGLRTFNTAKNEMENHLSQRFSLFSRQGVFGAETYFESTGKPVDIYDLPHLDGLMDNGNVPCSYTLYSFTSKP